MRYTVLMLVGLLMMLSRPAFAQMRITGTVKDQQQKAISSANITMKSAEGNILSYTSSNEKGRYTLSFPTKKPGSRLEITSLGFAKESIALTDQQQNYDIVLSESSIALPTVKIKNRPELKMNGDTLSYKVSDFSDKQDRVLGDVLKKMPGIEMGADGKISYNGKAISNFTIDGDNLLDDKYNIATKSIPQGAVDKVQVVQNDQPVKMLRNKTNSEDVAINITIKDEAKLRLMGELSLGAGIPGKFDENASGMMFNKKYKGINYLKANNIGKNPADDLISHNFSDYMSRLNKSKPDPFLSSGAAGVPDLPQNRYLFNQAALLNTNNLFNLKNDLQLKTNIYYMRDRQLRDYAKTTDITLPTGDIHYTENQHNVSHPDQLHIQATLNVNKDKFYLKNTLMADYNPTRYQVGLLTNGIALDQQLKQRMFDVSNEFDYMNTLKSGNIYTLYSYINGINRPEDLNISPGLNEGIFNGGANYQLLRQHIQMPTFFTNNYGTFKNLFGKFTQTLKAGFSYQTQQLQSTLTAVQNDQSEKPALGNGTNNLDWTRQSAFVEGTYEYLGDKLKATLGLPLTLQNFQYSDPQYQLEEDLTKLLFNPRLSLKYQTGIEDFLTLSLNRKTELGDIDDIYRGAILRNYRSLYANNAPLSEMNTGVAALSYNYRRAISMFFFSVQASYSHINLNTISSSVLNDNLQQRIVLPFENNTNVYNLSGSISKYLIPIRTTISGGLNYAYNTTNQIQNSALLPFKTTNRGLKAGIQSKLSNWVNVDYKLTYNQFHNKTAINSNLNNSFSKLNQQLAVTATLFNQLYTTLSGEHMLSRQTGQENLNYLFADLKLRYTYTKIHTDFELGITNLANIKTYKANTQSINSFTSATYAIPGRIALLKATFNY